MTRPLMADGFFGWLISRPHHRRHRLLYLRQGVRYQGDARGRRAIALPSSGGYHPSRRTYMLSPAAEHDNRGEMSPKRVMDTTSSAIVENCWA